MWIEEKELEEEMVRVDGREAGIFRQSYGLSFSSFSFALRVILMRM